MSNPEWDSIGATATSATPQTSHNPEWDSIGTPPVAPPTPETKEDTHPWDSIGASTTPQPKLDIHKQADTYLQDSPTRKFGLDASPVAAAEVAKAGTVGQLTESSDKQREMESIKNQAVGYFNAHMQERILDMEQRGIPHDVQDEVISRDISDWEKAGLPAGKFNAANPGAFSGSSNPNSLRDALTKYVGSIRAKGLVGATAPGAVYDNNGKLAVAQAPTALESAGLSLAGALPSSSGAVLGGELAGGVGGTLGPEVGIPLGVVGSMVGAYLGEKGVRDWIQNHGSEAQRNGLAAFDAAHAMGEEAHPVASWFGHMGAQAATMGSGLRDIAAGKGVAPSLAPRLTGLGLGAGIEAGSEIGQGESLDKYKLGESALSGMLFIKPRFMGEGSVPMSYEGRNWTDTNIPKPELDQKVTTFFKEGSSPVDVLYKLGKSLPDTPENRRALRQVSGDIRAGRDPSQSLDNLAYRPRGITVDQAVDAANQHIAGFNDAPTVHVHDNYDSASIPDSMKDKVGPGTLGWKDDSGEIHIIASQHATPDAIQGTMFHELMHSGLVRAYQEGLQDKLIQVYDNARPNLRDALSRVEKEQAKTNPDWAELSEEEQKSLVTDEVLASTAEHGIHSEAFDKAKAFIRDFGRTHLGDFGKKLSYSDAEVRQILSTGYDAVSKGSGDALGPVRYMNFGSKDHTAENDNSKLKEFNPEHTRVDPIVDEDWTGSFHHVDIRDPVTGNLTSAGKVHVDERGKPNTVTMIDPKTGEVHETSPETNDMIRSKVPIRDTDTRFSRKYSGNFDNDYEGRQKRTESLLRGHFGNFSINNLKGMMRPLEEYKAVSNDEVIAAAQELKEQGFDVSLAAAQGAIPDNSAFVVALKDLVLQKKDEAAEVAGRYRKSGGLRHERELMRAVTDLGQVLTVFDKTASNLGRMLHALSLRLPAVDDAGLRRMLDNVRFANGKLDTEQMDKIAQALISKDTTLIRKSIDKFDPQWKTLTKSLFYNHILGSSSVQIGNILGNATNIVKGGVGDILGYGVGVGREGLTKVGERVGLDMKPGDRMHLDELLNRAQGLLGGLLNEKTYNNHQAWNTAVKEFFIPAGQNEHENKFASQAISNLPLSVALEYGTRGLQAADAFFRTALEHSAMQAMATREARRLNNGKAPTTAQIADIMASPTREMLLKVKGEADRMLFQENPSKQAEAFSKLMRSVPGGWLIAPIIRTPANIGRTAFETFDPTGRITQRNRDALKAGGPEADRVRGSQLLAAALWAGAVYLMKNDELTGGGPSNPAARAEWLQSHVPYTMGNDKVGRIPLRGISPIGDGLSSIADLKDAYKYGTRSSDTSNADKALMVAAGMSDAFLSNSFASSVTDSLERGMKPTLYNLTGTLVQSAVSVPLYSQYKKETDPFVRDTSSEGSFLPTMADKAAAMDDPVASHYFPDIKRRDELPIRHTPFGEPILAGHPTSTDPISQEVGRLADSTGQSVVPAFSRTIKGQHVPNDIYENFLAFAGPMIRDATKSIMDDPVYHKTLNDNQRAALIKSNKNLKGLHARLSKQLMQMMDNRDPMFEQKSIPQTTKTLMTIPGE